MVIVLFKDNRGGGKLTITFLENLLLNSSVTITLMSYCLVPNAKDKAKKETERYKKKKRTKGKWLPFLFTIPSLLSIE